MKKTEAFKLEKERRKQEYKNKRNAKIARFRFGKNLFIWFIGLITSWVLVACLATIFLTIPLKNVLPQEQVNVQDKTALQVIKDLTGGNLSDYSLGNFPVLVDSVDGMLEDAGISKYVAFDKEKLKQVKFDYAGETNPDGSPKDMTSELMNCIVVKATLDNVLGENVGDFAKLSVYKDCVLVDQTTSTKVMQYAQQITDGQTTLKDINTQENESHFNPLLYCVEQDSQQISPQSASGGFSASTFTQQTTTYVNAFNKDGTFSQGVDSSSILYYRPLKNVPFDQLVNIITDTLSRVETDDVFVLAGIDTENPENSIIVNLLGGKTIKEVGEISTKTLYLSDILTPPDQDNPQNNKLIYDILVPATKPVLQPGQSMTEFGNGDEYWTAEDISLDSLSTMGVDNVPLTALLSTQDYQIMFDILKEATNADSYDNITISSLSNGNFNLDNISLTTFLPAPDQDNPQKNKLIYDVLKQATGAENYQDITLSSLQNINFLNIKLCSILPVDDNIQLYNTLAKLVKNKTAGEILVSDLTGITFDGLYLCDFVTLSGNIQLIIEQITQPTLADGESYADYGGNQDAIWDINDVTLSRISSADISKLKLSAIASNFTSEIRQLLVEGCSAESFDSLTITSLSNFSMKNLKLSSALSGLPDNLKTILEQGCNQAFGNLTVASLGDFAITRVYLSTVLSELSDEVKNMLADGCNKPYANVVIQDLLIFNPKLVKLSTVLGQLITQDVKNIIMQGCSSTDFDTITLNDFAGFNINKVKLSAALSGLPDKLKAIIDHGCNGKFENLVIADMANFSMDNLTIDCLMEYNPSSQLCIILCQVFNKTEQTYNQITINQLVKDFSLDNVKLSSVISASDNAILNALRCDDSVTMANIGKKINSLALYKIFGEDCWTDNYQNAINSQIKYSKTTAEDGTFTYNLDNTNGTYYIKKGAGIWLLMCYDAQDTNSDARADVYTPSSTSTFGNIGNGDSISSKIKNTKIRQLKDAGIFGESEIISLYDGITITELFAQISGN